MKLIQFAKENPALMLALVSGYIYLCTYEYESGYLLELQIPETYLSFDISSVLKDSVQVIMLGFSIVCFNELLVMIFKKSMDKSPEHKRFITFLLKIFILLAIMAVYGPLPAIYVAYVLAGFLGLFFLRVIWVLTEIVIEKIKKKAIHRTTKPSEAKPSQSTPIYNLVYSIVFPFIICQSLGSGEAYHQNKFQVIHDGIDYIVVRKYGDEIICKEIKKNRTLGSSIKIYKVSDTKPFNSAEESIKPIH